MITKLPKGWTEIQCKELFELKYGDSLPEEKRIQGDYNVYGSNGVVGSHNQGITKGKTIIVGRKGSIGKVNLSEKLCFPIDTTYYIDETKKPCDLTWLYYLLKILKLENMNKAAAVPGLNRNDVYQLKILFPPLETQQKIVSILEKAEQAKEWRKEADELTKEFLKAVFMEMFGYKKKFTFEQLGSICDVQSGGTPAREKKEYWEEGTIPWLGSTVCKDKHVNESEQFITGEGLNNSSARMFKKGTVLVALVGATIGKTAFLNFEASTNQNIAGIYPKKDVELNSEYLFYALQSLYHRFLSLSSDTFKMANLTFIRNLEIPLPPVELQKKFASLVKEFEVIKEQQKHSKEQIDKLFSALQQKAFKGELV